MNKWVYNSCIPGGISMVGVGVGVTTHWGVGLAVAGGLVVGLTMFGAWLAARSAD